MKEGHDREHSGEVDARGLCTIVEHDRHRRFGCRILDVRAGAEAPPDHLPGSGWVPAASPESVPAHMLPRQECDFVVLAEDARSARAMAAGLRRRGWRCRPVVETVPPEWLEPGPPEGALWQPDPFLEEMMPRLPSPATGPVLDLGCGSGRELVFLAMHGYRVVGLDRLPDALALADALARHHGVRWESIERRVRGPEQLPDGPFAAILNFRILVRGVLGELAPRLLPGGALVLRTYGWPDTDPGGAPVEVLPEGLRGEGPRRRHDRLSPEDLRNELTDPAWSFEVGPRLREVRSGLWLEALARSVTA